ncbi:MAG: hypothetical protein KKB51_21065 [Candidatus Riflebacteria bacterium]|nr:hypothetical protein [Candidatus Riflebacteria bacterium]
MNKAIGTFFMEEGILTKEQHDKVLEHARKNNRLFEEAMLELHFVDEETLTPLLGLYRKIPFVDLQNYLIDPVIGRIIPEHISRRHLMISINRVGNRLTIAMVDPTNIIAIDDVQLITGLIVKPVYGTRTAVMQALEEIFTRPVGVFS